jgi:DNA topoisomerase I
MVVAATGKRKLTADAVSCRKADFLPPPFEPCGLVLHPQKGKAGALLKLGPREEEEALFYAGALRSSDGRLGKDATFNRNFWEDWSGRKKPGGGPQAWDFDRLLRDRQACIISRKRIGKNKKVFRKSSEDDLKTKTADRPGIYIGRAKHNPLRGRIRRRLQPSDIDLGGPGSAWKARWTDPLTGKVKYIYRAADSHESQEEQRQKFETARRYGRERARILKTVRADLDSPDQGTRQCATCFHIIDTFAIRVGHSHAAAEHVEEKDAEPRGAATLRRRDVRLLQGNRVALDFVGKDSIRYVGAAKVDPAVWRNLRTMITSTSKTSARTFTSKGEESGKKQDPTRRMIFDAIPGGAQGLNRYLSKLMSGLTAKVIRTYRASSEYERILSDAREAGPRTVHMAAAAVAAMCNHQSQSKSAVCDASYAPSKGVDVAHAALLRASSVVADGDGKKEKTKNRDPTKCWARATTIANYIDPRITVAFCKRHGIDLRAVLSAALQRKFSWAVDELSSPSTSSKSRSGFRFAALRGAVL